MQFEIPAINWWVTAPFLIVVVSAVITLLLELVLGKRGNGRLVIASSLGIIAAIGVNVMAMQGHHYGSTFSNTLVLDPFAIVFNFILLGASLLGILISEPYLKEKRINYGEYYPLLLFATCGPMLMAASRDLIVLFLGLEILSLSLYVLTGISKKEDKSEEAAIKYFLLGAFASGFLLYGIALAYGASGSTHLEAVFAILQSPSGDQRTLLIGSLALLIVGFGFKSALVPFHVWTPDVYQGAPTSITGYMAAVVKVAAFAALFRIFESMNMLSVFWQPILFVISILTMTVGNIVALKQTNIKRLLAYSSIAQAGYILLAIISGQQSGLSALLFYLLVYCLMTIGAFTVLTVLAKDGYESSEMSDLRGLYQTHPFAAIAMILFMASLIGIPPLAGFWAKLGLIQASLSAAQSNPGPIGAAGQYILVIALAVNSAISAVYYLKPLREMLMTYGEKGARVRDSLKFARTAVVSVCVFGVIAAGLAYSAVIPLMNYASSTDIINPAPAQQVSKK